MAGPEPDPLPPARLRSAAEALFGAHLGPAVDYARLLLTDGVVRGLIGPREAPRLWERHLLNCVAVAELVPFGSKIVDVGSGAGLPGLALAIARPDLAVTLVEPMERRVAFLAEAVRAMHLGERTRVVRARAEDLAADWRPVDIATARAVATIDRLAAWCLPLIRTGGRLLAIKGESAPVEVSQHAAAIRSAGGGPPAIRQCGVAVLAQPTTVVEIERVDSNSAARSGRRRHRGRP